MENRLFVSVSPHVRDDVTVSRIMYSVVIALIPAFLFSVYFFGARALWVTVVGVLAAVATEAIIQRLMHKPATISDGSALVTGLLVAFNLPPGVPLWMPVVGSAFAIAIGKQVFGGLGFNPMNPALLGRAFLLASWPVHMTTDWLTPRGGTLSGIDVITTATPLGVFKGSHKVLADPASTVEAVEQAKEALAQLSTSYGDLFWGRVGGCIGETSAFLLLLGGIYLLVKRYINWRVPFPYIGTVALLSWIFAGERGLFTGDFLFHIMAGGLFLGAFFMATDMVTSPVTPKGMLIFGIGCGVITVVIRLVGGYPEGVSYSILLMNLTVPLLDRYTRPKKFGG